MQMDNRAPSLAMIVGGDAQDGEPAISAPFREIASGLRFPEGPIALADGSILVVEVRGGRLTRIAPDGGKALVAELGGGPNGAALGPDGKVYICNNGGLIFADGADGACRPAGTPEAYVGGSIQRVDLATGQVEQLYDRTAHGRLSSPNDIVFDRHGGFWFTDHGKGRERVIERGGVYYARADGSAIHEVLFPLTTPNGIGLSADETVLYVAETQGGRLWAFDLAAPGEVAHAPYPSPNGGRLLAAPGGLQQFDSLAVDGAGHICVGTIQDNVGISVFSQAGAPVGHVPTSDRFTTNICFGGPDLATAYVTLSGTGRVVALDWPRPGLPLNFLNR